MQHPYTYLIGWSKQNKFYYGSKYGKDANPQTLWVDYFTSSKYVKEFREKYGEPDIIEVRKTFDAPKDAQDWEKSVLKRMKVLHDDRWLNKNIGGRIYISEFSETHKANISKANSKPKTKRGKIACQENSKIATQIRTGQKDSEETKIKRSESMKRYHKKAAKLGIKRKPSTNIEVEGEIFYGYKAVAEKFNITVTTVHNRLNSERFETWVKL